MNLSFGITEIQTLNDLQVIAEKHSMKIHFGFNNSTERHIDFDILEKQQVDGSVIDILKNEDYITINNEITTCDKLWFELYEIKNDKSHTMAYLDNDLHFDIDYGHWSIESECQQALDDFTGGENYYSCNYSPTIINGFGNKETVTDFRVYRSGMALKFFDDLVCDFLGEPRIEKVY